MRLLAIGDIHGCSRAFDTLLDFLQVRPDDVLVTLGDYVDRGPDTRGVLDRLIRWNRTGQLIALRGNHEEMMLAARRSPRAEQMWRHCGGEEALYSYVNHAFPTLADIPESHWHFIEKTCVDWYEAEQHFFVHAGVDPHKPLEAQGWADLHWRFLDEAAPHCSKKIMVCGHSEQRAGVPRHLGFAIAVDTWAYGPSGWLSGVDVLTGQVWQANQRGETRWLRLEEPR